MERRRESPDQQGIGRYFLHVCYYTVCTGPTLIFEANILNQDPARLVWTRKHGVVNTACCLVCTDLVPSCEATILNQEVHY